VRLVHSGIVDDLRDGNAAGWDHYLPRLQLATSGRPAGAESWAVV
jgi:hypothetical protein